jgi:hypothetical protein
VQSERFGTQDSERKPDADAYTNTDTDAYTNTDTDTDADTNTDPVTDSYTDSNTNTNAYTHAYTDTDTESGCVYPVTYGYGGLTWKPRSVRFDNGRHRIGYRGRQLQFLYRSAGFYSSELKQRECKHSALSLRNFRSGHGYFYDPESRSAG